MFILCALAVAAAGEVVNVTTSKSLEQYLCPPTRTIPPNTDVIISVPLLNLTHDGEFCLIENTTNITISSSQELMNSKTGYAKVVCMNYNSPGFGFFNITNLTVRSVYFQNCENTVPPMAVRYINESDQFLHYNSGVGSTLILNHCCDLTLSQVFVAPGKRSYFSIIGVNLCGSSDIHLMSVEDESSSMVVLIYYTDSPISHLFSKYELVVRSNMIDTADSGCDSEYYDMERSLTTQPGPDRIPVSVAKGFGLYLTQQDFDVNVIVDITSEDSVGVLILFVNSITQSQVTFQSNSNELCDNLNRSSLNPTSLDIMFYERPTFQDFAPGIFSPMIVQNAAFTGFGANTYGGSKLKILKTTRTLSHQVLLENLSWCLTGSLSTLLHAQSLNLDNKTGVLQLVMVNISMHGTSSVSQLSASSVIDLIGVDNATMSGVNHFVHNMGGSVINLASSKLYVTGDLTIANGYAYKGGGMRLGSGSTLFLQEPLVARFYNNSAIEGNAIYAPNNALTESGVQILPSTAYSLDNITDITDIDMHLHFRNNTYNGNIQRSLYAPYFRFLGQQTSSNLLFDSDAWDSNHSQYVYTTLIDSIFKNISNIDKFSSLNNGICVRMKDHTDWNCTYIDQIYRNLQRHIFLYEVDVHPGEKAFSILNMDDIVYFVYTCNTGIALDQGVYWDTTVISDSHTKYLTFEFYHVVNSFRCMEVYMIPADSVQPIPVIAVRTTASCPDGFSLTDSGRCDCIPHLHDHGYQCDLNTKSLANLPGYWTGFHNEFVARKNTSIVSHSNASDCPPDLLSYLNTSTISFSTHCPPGYCNLSLHSDFVLDNSLSDLYCNDNRNGTLCGKCKTNYSTMFGSDKCHNNCSNLYLLTIPLYAVAGLLLVVALFALRLTVATGTINGVIFYANVMGLVMRFLIENHSPIHIRIFHVIISLLNLELGFPICFYSGMTPAAKVGLQFVFPVYVWSLVLLLVLLSKYSVRLTNLIMNSSVQVLATLFYLSFAKILRNVIDIVSYSSLQSIESYISYGSLYFRSPTSKIVWFYDGSDYGHGIHGFYLLLAVVFCVLFLLPYGVFSLGFTCSCRPFNKMRFSLKPFRDAYCGPFKDKWRFWFGLRLWVTALLYAISGGLQGHDTNAMFLVHLLVVGTLILLQAIVQPFRNVVIAILDTFFMLNYWFVLELYLLSKIGSNSAAELPSLLDSRQFSIAYSVFLGSAILVFCLILVGHVCVLTCPNFLATLRDKFNRRRDGYEPIEREDSDADQQLFEAAEERDPVVDTY